MVPANNETLIHGLQVPLTTSLLLSDKPVLLSLNPNTSSPTLSLPQEQHYKFFLLNGILLNGVG